jgi:hypothetical protein
MSISPWSDSASVVSLDGTLTAVIHDASEIAMGAPTSGELWLSNGIRIDSCNPSIVWSDDSRYLAVPQWAPNRSQRLVVVDVKSRERRAFASTFRVLQLDSFSNGWIEGIDSPINRPVRVVLKVEDLFGGTAPPN